MIINLYNYYYNNKGINMTEEQMKREAFDSAEFMKKQPTMAREQVAYMSSKSTVLNPNSVHLAESTMNTELSQKVGGRDWRDGPRNFYDHTKNSETINDFMSNHSLKTTGEYRASFLDKDKTEVNRATDASIRQMTLTHKDEMSKVSNEEKPTLQKLHKFESEYLYFRENVDLKKYDNIEQQSNAYKEVRELYKDYKATTLGFEKTSIKVEGNKVEQQAPRLASEADPKLSVQQRMMAMRNSQLSQGSIKMGS